MAIRVSHGDVGAFLQFGREAGKGKQKANERDIQARRDLTLMTQDHQSRLQMSQIEASLTAANINAETAIHKSVMDANNQRQLVEFQSYMAAESQRRQIAWEVEKIELSQRHDFDMNMQRQEMEMVRVATDQQIKEQEKTQKLDALRKAYEDFSISESEYGQMVTSVELGSRDPFGSVLASGRAAEQLGALPREATIATEKQEFEAAGPEATEERLHGYIKEVQKFTANDPETYKEFTDLLKDPDLTEEDVKQAVEIVKVSASQKLRRRRWMEALKQTSDIPGTPAFRARP